jgi:hypothetical protein
MGQPRSGESAATQRDARGERANADQRDHGDIQARELQRPWKTRRVSEPTLLGKP